ncbi:MAG: MBL fold metallo-hydrolase [Candidatus Aenigmarchaeota archaeon]|nr:MBL fold metallo-hydrolase [Candidatus Aenigmarchaeota archaeon]
MKALKVAKLKRVMVTITGLGGFREVGRSSVLVEGSGRLLMDYGINVQDMGIPIRPPQKLDGALLSHAHLDHCGILPELYKRGFPGRVYATETSLDLIKLMLRDALKVQEKRGLQSHFRTHDIETLERKSSAVKFKNSISLKGAKVTFFDAGHVPGSALILVEMDGKRILYTGDAKFQETELMNAAWNNFKDIDLLICESTYTEKDHPDRKVLRRELVNHVLDVVNNDGIAVLPCFAIGRSQELLQILSDLDVPLYLDGMGKAITQMVLNHPSSVRNPKKLRKAFGKARKIQHHSERFKLLSQPCAIVTTSGMLNGGPVSHYIKRLHKRENCSLYISGYQVESTVGRTLQDTGRYVNEGVDVKPKMQIIFRDWSAHAGRTGILNFVKKIRPKKVLFEHGSRCEAFAREVSGMGFPSIAPKNGEKVNV